MLDQNGTLVRRREGALDQVPVAVVAPSRAPRASGGAPRLFCPFAPAVSPHATVVQEASLRWARTFGLVASDGALRSLGASKIGWLVARAFPEGSREVLQIAADWTTLFCLLDDLTEAPGASPVHVAAYLSRLLEVLASGAALPGDAPAAHALLDLRRRLDPIAPPGWMTRFVARIEEIAVGFSWEAIHRARRVRPDLSMYLVMREITVGIYPQLELGELACSLTLPAEAREHPTVRRLAAAAVNAVGWSNDIFTYEKEIAQGEVHNLIEVLRVTTGSSLAEAVAAAVAKHDAEVRTFLELERRLPSFGDADADVRRYVAILRSWIRGHLDWAHETGRYDWAPDCLA
jgi:5-epi-alpha-selinene synthase